MTGLAVTDRDEIAEIIQRRESLGRRAGTTLSSPQQTIAHQLQTTLARHRAAGVTLRELADVTGLSIERVRQLSRSPQS